MCRAQVEGSPLHPGSDVAAPPGAVPPPANHPRLHGDLGKRVNGIQGKIRLLGFLLVCHNQDANQRLRGGKDHKRETCCTSEFSQISVIWSESRSCLERIKRLQNGNRGRLRSP